MSMFANNALVGCGDRVMVWIREQRKIIRRSKAQLDGKFGRQSRL